MNTTPLLARVALDLEALRTSLEELEENDDMTVADLHQHEFFNQLRLEHDELHRLQEAAREEDAPHCVVVDIEQRALEIDDVLWCLESLLSVGFHTRRAYRAKRALDALQDLEDGLERLQLEEVAE